MRNEEKKEGANDSEEKSEGKVYEELIGSLYLEFPKEDEEPEAAEEV